MRHGFQALPGLAGRPRPVVDVVVEGLEAAPQACLLDTGATEIRLGLHVAELTGVDLESSVEATVAVAGVRTRARSATVGLQLRQGPDSHVWSPTVYFCDPWPWAFGLFGLAGLDPFVLTLDPYEEWCALKPR